MRKIGLALAAAGALGACAAMPDGLPVLGRGEQANQAAADADAEATYIPPLLMTASERRARHYGEDAACYDRASEPYTAVVDSHLHFRPFGGPPIPFDETVSFLERTGVLYANVYGIGQSLPVDSPCEYYLDCPGTPALPSMKNDFANAQDILELRPEGVHLTLSMTFPDLANPEEIPAQIALIDREYPGMFAWMGEVNLYKQALTDNGHEPAEVEDIAAWAPFMEILRDRDIPLAIHADLGSDDDQTAHLDLFTEVLNQHPDNKIVWMHLGLSRELANIDPTTHVEILSGLLDAHPNLYLDISWTVIDDLYFSDPARRPAYVAFLNAHSSRVIPGTDFVAAHTKSYETYVEELDVTSRILAHLDDDAFRDIALGQSYFDLLGLDDEAPEVCR
ncbi:MAG: amidohydrolase family protein [Maricaulaceae bacterium]